MLALQFFHVNIILALKLALHTLFRHYIIKAQVIWLPWSLLGCYWLFPPSPRRISLSPRDSHKASVPLHSTQPPDTKPFRPFPTFTSSSSMTSFSPPPKAALYQMNLNLKMEIPDCLNHLPRGHQQILPDLSIEEFSDMSSSDPEDLFTDIHSSLESLNHLDAFSFFSEKHPLPAFSI